MAKAASPLRPCPRTGCSFFYWPGWHNTRKTTDIPLVSPSWRSDQSYCCSLPHFEICSDSISLSSVKGAHNSPNAPWPWVPLCKPWREAWGRFVFLSLFYETPTHQILAMVSPGDEKLRGSERVSSLSLSREWDLFQTLSSYSDSSWLPSIGRHCKTFLDIKKEDNVKFQVIFQIRIWG